MSDAPLLGRHDAVPRRRWRWLLPLLVGGAVLALVGTLVVRANQEDTSTPEYAVNAYLKAVQKGQLDRAYALLCAKRPPFQEFQDEVNAERRQNGGVTGHRLDRVEKRDGGQRVAYYTVRHVEVDQVFSVALVREAGAWRLCGFGRPQRRVQAPEEPADTGTTTTTR